MANVKLYIKKDGSKAYMFQAYVGINPKTGKPRRTTRRGFKSVREAKTAFRKLMNEVEQEGFNVKETYSFQEVYLMWEKQYEPTVKQVTFANMKSYFKNHILPHFEDMKIDQIDSLLCEEVTLIWGETIPSLQRLFHSYTKRVFEYAISHGIAKTNPMALVNKPKKTQVIVDESTLYYTKDELNFFLENMIVLCNYKVYTFFRLLAYTGVRKGEAFALCWNDVDFGGRNIRINKTVTKDLNFKPIIGPPKTINSNRVINVDQELINVLSSWKKLQTNEFRVSEIELTKNQLIFANPKNNLPSLNTATNWKNDFHARYKKRYKKEYKKIKTHGFRHTHASLLFEAGFDFKEVQDRLGHADIQTTMNIYTHIAKDKKESSGDKFAKFMSK